MKVNYTGKVELSSAQQRKIEAKIAKLGKLLDRKHERDAHVVVAQQRHLHKAEVTVNFHDHPLVGAGSSADPFTAIQEAIEKLEKQAIKVLAKWRDTKRMPRKATVGAQLAERAMEKAASAGARKAVPAETKPAPKVRRVNRKADGKPMTLDEAMLEMEGDRNYLVFRDAETDQLSVMIRRPDGNFDLIEA